MTVLSPQAVSANITSLPGWSVEQGKLRRTFRFGDFVTAFGFMSSVALVAESMNHHPEWSNVYGTVDVSLVTHDAGGITELDFELARAMQRLALRLLADADTATPSTTHTDD